MHVHASISVGTVRTYTRMLAVLGRILGELKVARRFTFIFAAALLITTLFQQTMLYARLNVWLQDWVRAVTAPELHFQDSLIIDIDEESMTALESQIGTWPYNRDVYALITRYLAEAGTKAIVFDSLFPERRPGDREFATAMQGAGNVLLASEGQDSSLPRKPQYFQHLESLAWPIKVERSLESRWNFRLPHSDFVLPHKGLTGRDGEIARTGVSSVVPDRDGVLRRTPLVHHAYSLNLPSLALAALIPPRTEPTATIKIEDRHIGTDGQSWPVDGEGMVSLQFPRNRNAIPVEPFYRVVLAALGADAYQITTDSLQGKTVFIGTSVTGAGDYAYVPIHGRMAGVEIVALAYENLVHNLVLKPASMFWNGLLVLFGAVIPLLISNQRRFTALPIVLTGLCGLIIALAIHLTLFGYARQQSHLLFPLLLGFTVLITQLLVRVKTLFDERQLLYYEKLAADEANTLKSQFLSHMTHELRTPLTAIMGFNRLLADEGLSPSERGQQVGVIEKNCNHLLTLINNLLDQAKIEAGQMSLEISRVNVSTLVDGVVATLGGLAEEKGLELRAHYAKDLPNALLIDELRLRQIVINLIGNALKFTDQGAVTLEVDWADSRLSIVVRDTGPGISESALSKVFDAFQQGETNVVQSHGGTGLGLTISHNLASLMGGNLSAESKAGEGASFCLSIPAPETQMPATNVLARGYRSSGNVNIRGRILVADDNSDIRDLLSLNLRKCGLEVLMAENGQQAVEVALKEHPDVVLMDMQMPVMNGIQAVRTLRRQRFNGIILALTAQSERHQIQATLDAGCNECIAKPVDRDTLRRIIDAWLNRTAASGSYEGVNDLNENSEGQRVG